MSRLTDLGSVQPNGILRPSLSFCFFSVSVVQRCTCYHYQTFSSIMSKPFSQSTLGPKINKDRLAEHQHLPLEDWKNF